MLLNALLSKIAVRQIRGPADVDISSICYDSRRAAPGALFVALPGVRVDGRQFVRQAIERGAAAVMAEGAADDAPGVAWVEVDDARKALGAAAAAFYRYPGLKLKLAGVTGTNGKTTTAYLLKHICERSVMRCGLIGTVRYEIGDESLPSAHTTPESLDLQELLSRMREAGCKAAAMEISSHAIAQNRISGLELDAAVFTNLTQDHLDFHGDLQSYFETKAGLFTDFLPAQTKKRGTAIINLDDRFGAELHSRLANRNVRVITYGVGNKADFRASNFKTELVGTSYQLDAQERSFLVRLPLIGKFNIYNSLAALAAATTLGVQLRAAVLALATAPAVPGRLQLVPAKRTYQVYVDYAHTDDALHNVLRTLRELNPHRLIVVFGCGGDRDRAKRPLMGRAAEQWADYAIVTSDNPRSEEPAAIIRDIEKGFQGRNYEAIVDRREAIRRAVALAEPRDIVLIAGKGHETYQQFAQETLPFDDVQVAQAAIADRPVELS